MRGLPKKTELNKPIPKEIIKKKFALNGRAKDRFDADIKKLAIIHELSPTSINAAVGKTIRMIFVMRVTLKTKDFDEKNILLISKLIEQHMIFVLEFEDQVCLAAYQKRLLKSPWQSLETLEIKLSGLNLDAIWENLLIEIGGIEMENGNSLDEQLDIDENRQKMEKQIAALEKQARAESQPKKKFALVQQIRSLEANRSEIN
ncbi:MAG: DUF4391 domain-containing protein [Eubacteriaceae bacterium]|nr:DUF4391 domain-containing protein [Eubacteriaceae bacterium]